MKSHTKIFLFTVEHVMVKDLRYVKIVSVNPLSLIIYGINGYIKESNRNKYLVLVPTDESKDTL